MRREIPFDFLAILLLITISSICRSQDSLQQGFAKLTEQIASKVTQQNKTTIAVIEFSDLQGNVTDFGRFLAEELITSLYSTEKFKVIERQLLNRVISEQKLNLSGMVDPKSAKELGKLLGVDAIVSGTITNLSKSLRINARLISTLTGEIFAVASTEIFKDESVIGLASAMADNTSRLNKENPTPLLASKESSVRKKADRFTFEILRCKRLSTDVVVVQLMITSDENDRQLSLYNRERGGSDPGPCRFYDNGGIEYRADRVQIGSDAASASEAYGVPYSESVTSLLTSDVPIRAEIRFAGVKSDIVTINAFVLACWTTKPFRVQFRNLPISQ